MNFKALTVFIRLILLMFVIGLVLKPFHLSAIRPKDAYKGKITQIKSRTDRDRDGIDDQTDILQNALSYVKKRPKYKSNYYQSGYPNDNCGVCTDVVAFAMLGAGYDLMSLVNADIAAAPEAYGIALPDKNIDFRRVSNLDVYFSRYASTLTTDITQIEEWQGGDIVIFEEHIGIVSERRNKRGIPYVIHHNAPFQRKYEEDVFAKRNDILGHYRIVG